MKKTPNRRHSGGGQRRPAMSYSSFTHRLLLWATGVANAELAFLAWIGVAMRSVRQSWRRCFGSSR